jgi:hypothetical protein
MTSKKSRATKVEVSLEPPTELINLRVPVETAKMLSAAPYADIVAALTAVAAQLRKPLEVKKPLLQRANELISGDRQTDYGNKLQNFSQIAMLWQGTLATKLQRGAHITPEDVALLMMQVKIARLAKNPDHEDSILDVAGYAGCYEAVQNERARGYGTRGATVDSRRPHDYPDACAAKPSGESPIGINRV